jgi:hypothetical protein
VGRLRGNYGPSVSSQDRWWGQHTIMRGGDPYMTRFWIGRLRLHIFYRGDHDPDCHDHPGDFYTFPLTSYVEEVLHEQRQAYLAKNSPPPPKFFKTKQIVRRFRLHYRPVEHCHRVLGRYLGPPPKKDMSLYQEMRTLHPESLYGEGKIITIVWQCGVRRKWGFWKDRDGRWCWQGWKDYTLAGGKNASSE